MQACTFGAFSCLISRIFEVSQIMEALVLSI